MLLMIPNYFEIYLTIDSLQNVYDTTFESTSTEYQTTFSKLCYLRVKEE